MQKENRESERERERERERESREVRIDQDSRLRARSRVRVEVEGWRRGDQLTCMEPEPGAGETEKKTSGSGTTPRQTVTNKLHGGEDLAGQRERGREKEEDSTRAQDTAGD